MHNKLSSFRGAGNSSLWKSFGLQNHESKIRVLVVA